MSGIVDVDHYYLSQHQVCLCFILSVKYIDRLRSWLKVPSRYWVSGGGSTQSHIWIAGNFKRKQSNAKRAKLCSPILVFIQLGHSLHSNNAQYHIDNLTTRTIWPVHYDFMKGVMIRYDVYFTFLMSEARASEIKMSYWTLDFSRTGSYKIGLIGFLVYLFIYLIDGFSQKLQRRFFWFFL